MRAAAEIRKLCITSLASAGYGHIGGSMSLAEILAVLYTDILRVDPKDPSFEDRDYIVLSKGHCGPALYAALAYKGFFDKKELLTLNQGGTSLPSHCDRLKTKGIDISTGSLGQGLSLAVGAAMGKTLRKLQGKVYAIIGDGELQEGQNWEALQFIAHRNIENLVIIVDNNRRQLDGYTDQICRPFDLIKKFEAFGIGVLEADGHDVKSLFDSLKKAKDAVRTMAVICNTVKGYGCNFAEQAAFNHYMVITPEMAQSAIREIDERLEEKLCI